MLFCNMYFKIIWRSILLIFPGILLPYFPQHWFYYTFKNNFDENFIKIRKKLIKLDTSLILF